MEMKAAKRKLNSKTGASLLISLMYYLVVMMVGLVCLVAAYNNVGRMTHELPDQQEYHAVESAISLITEDMKQADFLLKANYKNEEITSYSIEENKNDDYGKIVSCLLGEEGDTYTPSSIQGIKQPFTLNLSGTDASNKNSEGSVGNELNVKGDITFGYSKYGDKTESDPDMETDFTLIISLWEEKESGNSNESGEGTSGNNSNTSLKSNKTVLTFSPLVQEIKEYDAVSQTSETKIRLSWMEQPMIENEDLRPDSEDSNT